MLDMTTAKLRSVLATAALATGLLATMSDPAADAAAARPAFAGREVFRIYASVPGPRHAAVTARGAFRASGVFIRRRAALVFPKGQIVIRRRVLHTDYQRPDLANCTFKITENGTFRVLSATGRYRGLTERGAFRSTVQGKLNRTGPDQCGQKMVSYHVLTYETGTVH